MLLLLPDDDDEKIIIDRSNLPTAPRASLGPTHLDLERIPTDPPFTCFLGNMPFDVAEEEIINFFGKMEVFMYCFFKTGILLNLLIAHLREKHIL